MECGRKIVLIQNGVSLACPRTALTQQQLPEKSYAKAPPLLVFFFVCLFLFLSFFSPPLLTKEEKVSTLQGAKQLHPYITVFFLLTQQSMDVKLWIAI